MVQLYYFSIFLLQCFESMDLLQMHQNRKVESKKDNRDQKEHNVLDHSIKQVE